MVVIHCLIIGEIRFYPDDIPSNSQCKQGRWHIWYMVHSDFEVLDEAIDPLVGAFVNVCVCLAVYFTQKQKTEYSSLKEADDESDSKLTYQKILEYMGGMVEPFTYKRGLYLWLSLSFVIFSLAGRIDSISPDINSLHQGQLCSTAA